jgi:hypothetical protein
MHASAINPFFAARVKRAVLSPRPQARQRREPEKLVYARLTRVPRNASPLPPLTGLYHNAAARDIAFGSNYWRDAHFEAHLRVIGGGLKKTTEVK